MKRYLLFMYDQYYPSGGWGDFKGSFDTLEEALAYTPTTHLDCREVVDSHTGESVYFS